MRVELNPLFGKVPSQANNLEIVGPFRKRFELNSWATVWPDSGVIRWQDGTIEPETIWVPDNLKDCGDYHSLWSWFPRPMRGRFFNLSLFWWPNYYHWLCDVLPRLREILENLDPEVRIILPQRMTAFHRHTLELIGVPARQQIQHTGRRPWKVEHLNYVSPPTMTGDHEPQSLLWMRAKILEGCWARRDAKPGNRRLYISRQSAASRRMVNEDELRPVLKNYGFEIIDPGSMKFEKQVEVFSEAAVIAGPHGAGFTNMLWSACGTRVFEIFEPGSVRRCYWSLARALGHSYHCGVAETESNKPAEPNLRVNADDLEQALEKICRDQ